MLFSIDILLELLSTLQGKVNAFIFFFFKETVSLSSGLSERGETLAFFSLFFFFVGSLYLSRVLVLRSVRVDDLHFSTSSGRSVNTLDAPSSTDSFISDEYHIDQCEVLSFVEDIILHEEESLQSPSNKYNDENTLLKCQGEDDHHLSLSHPPIHPIFNIEGEIKRFSGERDEGKDEEEIEEGERDDSSSMGSTSKSSIATDNLFSSSSRRHSANWESYAFYRKYEEEMGFIDRLISQKLNNAGTLRAQERNLSPFKAFYHELEQAYVSHICLSWEILSHSYHTFLRARSRERNNNGSSFAAITAQKCQEFHVLLRRFIENEPFERGSRVEIYARARTSFPRFFQVPEIQCSGEQGGRMEEESRVSGEEFQGILDECISTFMAFLKERGSHWRVFRERMRCRLCWGEETLLHVLIKKKRQLKDLQRKKKRRKKRDEEREIMLSLTDVRVVSRVLRMRSASEVQLHWCREKMSRVNLCDGQIRQDFSPLFFPVR